MTAVPAETVSRPAPAARRPAVDADAVATRAYAISISAEARSPAENWYRAERELRREAAAGGD